MRHPALVRPVVIDIPYTREFPHPIEQCYAWLTDYTDRDPSLTHAVLKERRVLERTPERVLLEVRNEVMGADLAGQAEVLLHPEEFWYEAKGLGRGKGVHYVYRLAPLGPSRTRLDVHYTHRTKRFGTAARMMLARPLIRRQLGKMWDGLAASMAKDLRG